MEKIKFPGGHIATMLFIDIEKMKFGDYVIYRDGKKKN